MPSPPNRFYRFDLPAVLSAHRTEAEALWFMLKTAAESMRENRFGGDGILWDLNPFVRGK